MDDGNLVEMRFIGSVSLFISQNLVEFGSYTLLFLNQKNMFPNAEITVTFNLISYDP